MPSMSSIAPVLAVPAEAATRNGRHPPARSASTISASRSTRMRSSPSTGTRRSASLPSPSKSNDLAIERCASTDA